MVTLIEKPTAGALDARRHRRRQPAAGRGEAPAPHGAARLPEPLRLAQPAQEGRRDPGRAAGHQHRPAGGRAHARGRATMMAKVGLRPEHYSRYPHMFSGGQRQRIAIARALMLSAEAGRRRRAGLGARRLDPGAGAQPPRRPAARAGPRLPVHLARSRRRAAHRPRRAGHVSRPRGRARPEGARSSRARCIPTRRRCSPRRRASRACKRKRIVLKGELPSPLNPPKGCVFSTRCPYVTERCRAERPPLRPLDGRLVACHYAEQFLGA